MAIGWNTIKKVRKMHHGAGYKGLVVDYHQTGEIALRGQYKDGIRKGKWTWHYENGTVKDVKNHYQYSKLFNL